MSNFEYYYSKILKKLRGRALSDSRLHCTSKIGAGTSFICSTMDKYSYCGYDCNILNTDISAFCSLANHVVIGGIAHPTEYVSTSPVFLSHGRTSVKKKFASHSYLPRIRTTIGNDVWVGEGAYIRAGVNIGNGAVVGMSSVVTKDIPPYAIVAGNPAKIIRMRFEDKIITALINACWWNLPDADLTRLGKYFNNPIDFLREINKLHR